MICEEGEENSAGKGTGHASGGVIQDPLGCWLWLCWEKLVSKPAVKEQKGWYLCTLTFPSELHLCPYSYLSQLTTSLLMTGTILYSFCTHYILYNAWSVYVCAHIYTHPWLSHSTCGCLLKVTVFSFHWYRWI